MCLRSIGEDDFGSKSELGGVTFSREGVPMKEPGLDDRHRNKDGKIQQKRSDTINKNLPEPIEQFSPNAKLGTMRKMTGKTSEKDVREFAKKLRY